MILASLESDSRANLNNEQSIMSMGEAKVYVYTHVRLLELNIIDGICIRLFFFSRKSSLTSLMTYLS